MSETPEQPKLSPAEAMSQASTYEGDPLECPCIADMKKGSCGVPFINAYRCYLDSKHEEKGMDCIDLFREMQTCMIEHREEYEEFLKKRDAEDEDEDEDEEDSQAGNEEEIELTDSPSTRKDAANAVVGKG